MLARTPVSGKSPECPHDDAELLRTAAHVHSANTSPMSQSERAGRCAPAQRDQHRHLRALICRRRLPLSQLRPLSVWIFSFFFSFAKKCHFWELMRKRESHTGLPHNRTLPRAFPPCVPDTGHRRFLIWQPRTFPWQS